VTQAPAAAPAATPAPTTRAAAPVVGTKAFTPPPGSGGNGLAAIYAVFGNSPGLSWALRVANCESHYNPLAINRSSGASGLFQFMPSTWNANFPGQNIWDPYAQAHAALVFYNAGRQSAWTCK
jgi:soluble lytic murein transglycosylase-like protein